ncbi:MAG TPA: FtsX-like permease family protein [Chitinophagales bacterium]|nr:FtsX-like permease family protein [Chitinophagales bacterium]
MLKNYYKIAWRNIRKRFFYSSLNILGLSIGILFTLLIGAYVWNELRVNRTLRNAENQYFLESEWKDPRMGQPLTTAAPLAKRLKEDYPNLVANYYRWDGITSGVSKDDKHFRENIQLGDSTLLSMYGFGLLYGDARTALNNPYSVVITKEGAMKYFGKTDIVNETISIQSFSGTDHDFIITGVLKDIPENSVTQINAANHNMLFIPTNTSSYFNRADFESWNNTVLPSYIELQKGVTAADLQKPIAQLIQQNAPDGIKKNLTVHPVALTAYYLHQNNGLVKRMLYALSFVGLFILLMAIINFINISISSSSSRIKEIGLRKVLGGIRKQIIFQFLTESVLLVLFAMILAVSAYPLARPYFSELVGKKIPGFTSFPLYFIFIPAILVLVVGILAGLYPAIRLSSLKSSESIKGKIKTVKENVLLRKSLAGFQFCIASVVMIAAFVVSRQVSYFFSQSLGYNKEYIVSSQVPRDWSPRGVKKIETIRNELASMPQISSATLSFEIPNGNNGGQVPVYRAGEDSAHAITTDMLVSDENYVATYEVPMKAGVFFAAGDALDSTKAVLNEKAIHELGWQNAEEAVGKQVRIPGGNFVYTITGVVSDFHFASMQQQIRPIIFFHVHLVNRYRFLSFKIRPGNIASTIDAIQKKWAVLLPGSSFEYTFMDETLKIMYMTELQLKKSAYIATLLSLIIVLLGVLGLVSLSIQKRTKEIGVRKVLGASVSSIMSLFMKEILWVILVAGIVACPIAWLIMNSWLSDYAYRIPLTAEPFVISVAGLVLITALLIVIQTLKAGTDSPVKSLRTE